MITIDYENDFMPINVTFVCQFLPMDSEND